MYPQVKIKKKNSNQKDDVHSNDDVVANVFNGNSQMAVPSGIEEQNKQCHLNCRVTASTTTQTNKQKEKPFHRENSIESFFSSDSSSNDRGLPSPPVRRKSQNLSYLTHKSMTRKSIRIINTASSEDSSSRNDGHSYSNAMEICVPKHDTWPDDTSISSSSSHYFVMEVTQSNSAYVNDVKDDDDGYDSESSSYDPSVCSVPSKQHSKYNTLMNMIKNRNHEITRYLLKANFKCKRIISFLRMMSLLGWVLFVYEACQILAPKLKTQFSK